MASVFNKTTGEYKTSVHSPEYDSDLWVINPNISTLVADGVPRKYWKANLVDAEENAWNVIEMTQPEKDAFEDELSDRGNTTLAGSFFFQSSGNVKDKWLGIGAVKSAKSAPYIVPQPIVVSALTFTNIYSNAETDIQIYQNDTKVFSWKIDKKKWAYKANGLYGLQFNPGDRINVYLKKTGKKSPRDVVCTMHYTVINRVVDENSGT